jgi:hypothetical protein
MSSISAGATADFANRYYMPPMLAAMFMESTPNCGRHGLLLTITSSGTCKNCNDYLEIAS